MSKDRLREDAYWIRHCEDGDCDLGTFDYTCPCCEAEISCCDLWWFSEVNRCFGFNCKECNAHLQAEWDEGDAYVTTKDDPPEKWWTQHSPECDTLYRGCSPSCIKNIYETTGIWTGPKQRNKKEEALKLIREWDKERGEGWSDDSFEIVKIMVLFLERMKNE